MKKLFVTTIAVCAIGVFASPAFAGDDMSGKSMSMKPSATSSNAALTDAEVKKVDAATGMITLKHGEFANIGMAAMTMAYKAKDAAMVKQAHEGDKVKVRVEDVNGTLTIVKLVKQS
ncbi:copper-binding protein [Burkholderia cenocepacia]|uniref:copper-binding protein n=1 Tax=Burkholderia cenocepacia TaxID=95486 RepID=UPI000F5B0E28|nr:copper-binding protein [Burkholderia cenocepacia]ELW9530060.1 copper-binding protein [Burkholderia cenocepacia]MDN7631567.1 copper-binding protein [Burkholderia cenocepacia]RQU28657.1 RND transporter MFP subunit [Burkholderia cenocepacia]